LIYANLLPLHQPLRLAEELAMLDCMSNGRIISGFARGIPREYAVHSVAMAESRERFEEAYEIITRAWTEDVFSFKGKFWSYQDIALWPRPLQQPNPPVWIPVTSSRESLEWAAARDIPITAGGPTAGVRADSIRHYAKCLAARGKTVTPDHISLPALTYVADSKQQAIDEYAPYHLYFNRTLYSHGNVTENSVNRASGYVSASSTDYVSAENKKAAERSRDSFRKMTIDDVTQQAQTMPWGTADEVAQRLIDMAEKNGAGTLLLSMNRGAMPHDMFMNQIRRFAREVLPILQAHEIKVSPFAEKADA
jgi:alkanesulfonate monooxygenase SsuD/methylene tetrahydromethanopterin reductase-like flavin-dependent oxidoreductase (luciferase family)